MFWRFYSCYALLRYAVHIPCCGGKRVGGVQKKKKMFFLFFVFWRLSEKTPYLLDSHWMSLKRVKTEDIGKSFGRRKVAEIAFCRLYYQHSDGRRYHRSVPRLHIQRPNRRERRGWKSRKRKKTNNIGKTKNIVDPVECNFFLTLPFPAVPK